MANFALRTVLGEVVELYLTQPIEKLKIKKLQMLNKDTPATILPSTMLAEVPGNKLVLDACCGSRMFWFDRENPIALFADIREEEHTLCDGRKLTIKPDVLHDFRDMPYPDRSFKMVVFDPPHLNKLGGNSWMAKKYGKLLPSWEDDIKAGFDECMRVLDNFGILIFKWNENQISVSSILKVVNATPLFGHPTNRSGSTHWMAFMKLPE